MGPLAHVPHCESERVSRPAECGARTITSSQCEVMSFSVTLELQLSDKPSIDVIQTRPSHVRRKAVIHPNMGVPVSADRTVLCDNTLSKVSQGEGNVSEFCAYESILRGRGDAVVRILSSLLPPSRRTGFSHTGIVPDDAAGRLVFLGISRLPRPYISALLHIYSPRFTIVGFQALEVKSRPNLFTPRQVNRSVLARTKLANECLWCEVQLTVMHSGGCRLFTIRSVQFRPKMTYMCVMYTIVYTVSYWVKGNAMRWRSGNTFRGGLGVSSVVRGTIVKLFAFLNRGGLYQFAQGEFSELRMCRDCCGVLLHAPKRTLVITSELVGQCGSFSIPSAAARARVEEKKKDPAMLVFACERAMICGTRALMFSLMRTSWSDQIRLLPDLPQAKWQTKNDYLTRQQLTSIRRQTGRGDVQQQGNQSPEAKYSVLLSNRAVTTSHACSVHFIQVPGSQESSPPHKKAGKFQLRTSHEVSRSAARTLHAAPVQSLARSSDGALNARGSVALIAPMSFSVSNTKKAPATIFPRAYALVSHTSTPWPTASRQLPISRGAKPAPDESALELAALMHVMVRVYKKKRERIMETAVSVCLLRHQLNGNGRGLGLNLPCAAVIKQSCNRRHLARSRTSYRLARPTPAALHYINVSTIAYPAGALLHGMEI
ncbi:hypothetical protein PR048_017470 [Dryococelus australis]|uniref:Uncharacterized protein n=1 Tax=Dryococelus australis TaxID=614101 RepID=A0ABQ9H9L8_9NEOP|nr:hypothetical protein PR048_017470 [Dryococelus australis]